jgi:hypothetical protein
MVGALGVTFFEPSYYPNLYPALALLSSWNLIIIGVLLLLPQHILLIFFNQTFLRKPMKLLIVSLYKGRFFVGILWILLGLLSLYLELQQPIHSIFKK